MCLCTGATREGDRGGGGKTAEGPSTDQGHPAGTPGLPTGLPWLPGRDLQVPALNWVSTLPLTVRGLGVGPCGHAAEAGRLCVYIAVLGHHVMACTSPRTWEMNTKPNDTFPA